MSAGALGLAAIAAAQTETPDWREVYQQSRAAHEQKDYTKYRDSIYSLLELLHGHPEAIFAMAKAESLIGNQGAAAHWLRTYARTGLYKDIAAENDLAAMRGDKQFEAIGRLIDQNRTPISNSRTLLELADDLIPEDIAFDSDSRRFLVTSIRRRKVIWIDEDRKTGDWLTEGQDDLWAALAIGIDPHHKTVWVTTEAMPQATGYHDADRNRSALRAYDLRTAKLLKHLEVPDRETPHELGDLTIAPDGTVFVSDGKTGRLYRATRNSTELDLLSAGFASPQAPVVWSAKRVLVADYTLGILAIDLQSKTISPIKHPLEIPLNGIDCLMKWGRQLIAVQNGTNPPRVIRFHLSPSNDEVTRADVLERNSEYLGTPTHGVVRDSRFYYLANTGFENFDAQGAIVAGKRLSPSRILYCELK